MRFYGFVSSAEVIDTAMPYQNSLSKEQLMSQMGYCRIYQLFDIHIRKKYTCSSFNITIVWWNTSCLSKCLLSNMFCLGGLIQKRVTPANKHQSINNRFYTVMLRSHSGEYGGKWAYECNSPTIRNYHMVIIGVCKHSRSSMGCSIY